MRITERFSYLQNNPRVTSASVSSKEKNKKQEADGSIPRAS
jgi:hypothetical protein